MLFESSESREVGPVVPGYIFRELVLELREERHEPHITSDHAMSTM
jgi:hypothetical protein